MIIDILTSWWCIGLIGVAIGIIIGLIGLDFKHFDGIIHMQEHTPLRYFEVSAYIPW